MQRLRNLNFYSQGNRLFLPNVGSSSGGSDTGTGDQNGFNMINRSSITTVAAQEFGGTPYAPINVVSDFNSAALDWVALDQNRLFAFGPTHYIEEDGVVTVEFMCRGGTNTSNFRAGLYLDNGNALITHVGSFSLGNDAYDAGSRPGSLLAMHAQTTVNAGANAAWRGAGSPITVTSGQIVHAVLWLSDTASAAQFLRFNGGSLNNRYRSNSGTAPYNSTNNPPSPFPASTDQTRFDVAHRIAFTPNALNAPSNITATLDSSTRQMVVNWDARQGAEFYRVERQISGDDLVTVGVVNSTSYTDLDLQPGISVRYGISPVRKNNTGLTGLSDFVTVTGLRIETTTVTPSANSGTTNVWNPMRGLSGGTINVTGVTDYESYQRVGFHWGAFQTTSNPATFTWSALDNFLNGLSANQRAWVRFRTSVPSQGNLLPPFVTSTYRNTSGGAEYPNWNDPQVKEWLENWIVALGNRYNNDDRIQFMDMGFYAQFGEWTGTAGSDPASPTTKRELIDWITEAFSNKIIVMSAMDTSLQDDEETFWYTLNKPNVVAIRQDALGRETTTYMAQQVYGNERSLRMKNRVRRKDLLRACEHFTAYNDSNSGNWRIALEDTYALRLGLIGGANVANVNSLGTDNFNRVIESFRIAGYRIRPTFLQYPTTIVKSNTNIIKIGWINTGFGFVVDNRPVFVQLRQSGSVVWEQQLSVNLSTLYEGDPEITTADTFIGLNSVPNGTYQLCIEGKSIASGRVPAFNFDITNTRSGGSYIIGNVTVQ